MIYLETDWKIFQELKWREQAMAFFDLLEKRFEKFQL
jgi:hypothetical protein